jgi:transposase-like protein
MGRKLRVDRSPEEKWQIVQEGIKSGNVSETCRRHGIAPNLFYRWKDEAEQGAKAALGGRSAASAETEISPAQEFQPNDAWASKLTGMT